MTEGYGSGVGDEGGQRPSGRGAVTERLARSGHGAHEVDLTDEAAAHDQQDDAADRPGPDQDERESSGAFEPAGRAAPTADPPAEAGPGPASIFDVGERARQEDQEPTGYEPPLSDAEPATPRGETNVTEPGEPTEITPTPVPAAEPPAGAAAAPVPGGPPASLLGSLDAAAIRNRFLDIQAGFVDEPRQAVEEAGRFVDELVQQVIDALQGQRGQLGGPAPEGSTEDLRQALRAYRQFVDRLLGLAG
ncbi:MAG TPA: hypothetical protein VFC13_08560 [Actinomycetes bacterium]|nr:hypothetical protein [Actinomycetes bacterium]